MDTNVMLSAIIFRSANAVRTIELASGRDHGLGRREDRQPFHHHADRVRERFLMTFPRRLEAEKVEEGVFLSRSTVSLCSTSG